VDRYTGKPFLKLLDCYVLKAIGGLDIGGEEMLRKMEPHLARTFNTSLPWDRIVAEQMDFPDEYPAFIRKQWERYQAWAKAHNEKALPEEFVFEFMDNYFHDIVYG